MILSNLDHIPEREVKTTLGIVFGYSHSKVEKGSSVKIFEKLFKEAEKDLVKNCNEKGGDGILKIDGKITRDLKGRPEILLVGTAVKLVDINEKTGISLKMDGEEKEWNIPVASTSSEIAKMIRERGRSDREEKKKRKDIYDLADEIGISFDRAKLLMDNGFSNLESIADSSNKDLAAVVGINPTQARILKKKARELLNEERGL